MDKQSFFWEKILFSFLIFFLVNPLWGEEPFHSSLSFSLDDQGVIESRWDCVYNGFSYFVLFKKGDDDPVSSVNIKHKNFKGGKLSFEGLLYEMKAKEITVSATGLCKSAVDINRTLLSPDYYGMSVSLLNDNLGVWVLEFDGSEELGLWQTLYPFTWLRISCVETLSYYNGEVGDDYWYKEPEPFVGGMSALLGGEATVSFDHFLFRGSGAASFNEYLPVGGDGSVLIMGLWPGGRIYTKAQFNTREFITLRGETRKKIFQVQSGIETHIFDFILARTTHTFSIDFFENIPLENIFYGKLGCFFTYGFFSFYGGVNLKDSNIDNSYIAWETGLTLSRFNLTTRNKLKWSEESLIDMPCSYNRISFNFYITESTTAGVGVDIDNEEKWIMCLSLNASLRIGKCTAKGGIFIKDLLASSEEFSGESWKDSPLGIYLKIKIRQ